MREIFTYGSVGGAPGNRCSYLEADQPVIPALFRQKKEVVFMIAMR